MKKYLTLFSVLLIIGFHANAQDDADAFKIKEIFEVAMTKGECYENLRFLTKKVGPRLSGTTGAAAAVEYGRQSFHKMGFDSVWLQPCMVPHWERGAQESASIVASQTIGTYQLNAIALGGSGGSGLVGVTAPVVEVKSLDEAKELGSKLKGKIVFYNRPMDPTQFSTFAAYGGAVDQRVWGPKIAAQFGAVGAVVRSMTTRLDDVPHTGSTVFNEGVEPIPAIAISTRDANLLSEVLKKEAVRINIRTFCEWLPKEPSFNVVGEIKGSEFPDEIILVGGHLDSWDVNEGAHDDGSGVVQALEVINIFKQLGIRPKRTIRCVWFMNEENGQAGAIAYADWSNGIPENHIAAIESDRGGFTPRGFTSEGDESTYLKNFKRVKAWESLLAPYHLRIGKGGSGADISRLKPQKGILFGLQPDSQRYFDFHHAPNDVFENVNQRELELGAASMAALVYLLDKYGL